MGVSVVERWGARGMSDPTEHYNSVVEAWAHLLGEDLHYGYFHTGQESLVDATDALTDQMMALAELSPGLSVLDIGCGTGKAACRLATEHACEVVGISPSVSCIDGARALASDQGIARGALFQLGDGTAVDFPDAHFDRVWVMESSHLMDDKAALLRECARVLKPGGRMVLCDIMLGFKLSLEQVIDYRDEFLLLRDVFGRARMEPRTFYEDVMQANGLVPSHGRNITQETAATFERWRINAAQNKEEVQRLIGTEGWQQFSDACDVLEKFWQLGVLGYGIVAAHKPS